MTKKNDGWQLNLFGKSKDEVAHERLNAAYRQVHDQIKENGGDARANRAYNSQVEYITRTPKEEVNRGNADEKHAHAVGYEEGAEHLKATGGKDVEAAEDAANFGFWRWPL